ncbi:MAG: hypothetical protein ACKOA6_12195 [Actinomycetota bacterium]
MSTVALATTGGFIDTSSALLHIAGKWPRPVTVIEADPDGGRLACRHGLRPGLSDLVSTLRLGRPIRVADRVSAVPVVSAPPDPDETIRAIDSMTPMVGSLGAILGTDVLFSVGVLRPRSPSDGITRSSDARLLIMRCTLDDVAAVLYRHRLLESFGRWSILTSRGPLTTLQVSRVIRWPILAEIMSFGRCDVSLLSQRVAEFVAFVGSGTEQ